MALQAALAGKEGQLGLQLVHAPHKAPSVYLQLGLARATGTDPARLLRQFNTSPPQARQPVAELRELDLDPALLSAGVLGKYVQDHSRAVDRGATEDLLQVARLGGRELVVENDRVGVHGL